MSGVCAECRFGGEKVPLTVYFIILMIMKVYKCKNEVIKYEELQLFKNDIFQYNNCFRKLNLPFQPVLNYKDNYELLLFSIPWLELECFCSDDIFSMLIS